MKVMVTYRGVDRRLDMLCNWADVRDGYVK